MDSKQSFEKHAKYVNFYHKKFANLDTNAESEEYWGLGIENESYLMFQEFDTVTREFIRNNRMPERYSVDYWRNFKTSQLVETLKKLPAKMKVPLYINSYGFRKMDLLGEHMTLYTKGVKENPMYSGQSIDEYLRRVSPEFIEMFEKNVIYDGDTFEFATFNFYKANVIDTIDELKSVKANFLAEINKRLVSKFTIFKKPLVYPQFNYGFVKYQTNQKNVGVCNNGTYHINITLPTKLKAGKIHDEAEFKAQHANAIRAIQWIEPFLVGLYGSPDVLHLLDSTYSGGSQRLNFSRYIGLGTYNSNKMEKGKLLDTFTYDNIGNQVSYFLKIHQKSPYIPPKTIGYDFNYNKFTRHGIELRIFDYFPEQYLESVMNLIILVCQHSLLEPVPDPREDCLWNELAADAITKGSDMKMSDKMIRRISEIFDIGGLDRRYCLWPFSQSRKMKHVAKLLSSGLYTKYSKGPLSMKMSPNMKPIKIVDYNSIIKAEYKKLFL